MSQALSKARQMVEDAYYDERGMQDVMRQDAAIYAAIAQAEALTRIATALESLATTGCAVDIAEKLRQLAK